MIIVSTIYSLVILINNPSRQLTRHLFFFPINGNIVLALSPSSYKNLDNPGGAFLLIMEDAVELDIEDMFWDVVFANA
jgi:hypothetical protein